MKETTFTRQFMQNWLRQQPHLWWHKVADPMFGFDTTAERAVDVVGCCRGICLGMEWKIKKNKRAFPYIGVRQSQIDTLCKIHKAGGVALLMIAEYLGPHSKCVYAIPIAKWLKKRTEVTDRKSINLAEHFSDCCIHTYRTGDNFVHWNVAPIEELINERLS